MMNIVLKIKTMTQQEFNQHRQTWLREWSDKWRLLDIDFESYMLMKGMAPEEYKTMNEESWKADKTDLAL
jgi:hypothetical protein